MNNNLFCSVYSINYGLQVDVPIIMVLINIFSELSSFKIERNYYMHFSVHWLKLTLLFCGMPWWHTYLAIWLGMVCTCDGMLDVQCRKYVCIKLYIIQTHMVIFNIYWSQKW